MRIIAGNFKGKKIFEPRDKNTRPLKDLTKESIFNIIIHSNKFSVNLDESTVLDLFSGIGSFGIECLSRNALFVVFIENYKEALQILKKNILNLKKITTYSIIEKDIHDEFKFNSLNLKFDIIFMDPPYKERNLKKILEKVSDSKILKNNGVIIIHRHKNENNDFPKEFKILEEKKYGISKIIFGNFI
tara:strand:+ start:47 stop:610 length:564 start_codon:yes stop_codon:yes gene_type:complete